MTYVATAPVAVVLPEGITAAPAAPRVSHRVQVIRVVLVAAVWAIPLLRPAGPGNTGPVDMFVVFAVLVTALWLSGQGHRIRVPYAVPVGLAIIGGALAALVTYSGRSGGVGGGLLALLQDAFLLLWVVAIANIGRSPTLLRSVTRAAAISVTVWAAVLIIAVFGHISAVSGITTRDGSRAAFTLGDPNLAANYFVCMLFVLRATKYPRRRPVRWACCALILTAMFLTGSNGGALVLAIATVLGCMFTLAKRRGAAAATVFVSAALLVGAYAVPHISIQAIAQKAQTSLPILKDSIGRQAESSGSRNVILTQTVKLYLTDDSLFGLGPNGVKSTLRARQYAYVKMAHDDYAAALVERGVLGALGLLLLLVMVATRARRIATRPLRSGYAAIVPRPELLGAGAAAMFISACFYEVLHFRHVWLLFGLIAALDLWGRKDRDAEALNLPEVTGLRPMLTDLAWRVRRQPLPATGFGVKPAGRLSRFRLSAMVPSVLTANVAARVVALATLAMATILVARSGGPKLVGELTLLRVLPGLAGVLACCGLPTAVPYFLARRDKVDRARMWTTLVALMFAGALLACAGWLALSPVLHRVFFQLWGMGVVLAATVAVFSQLFVAVGKSFLQGENDMRGANWAIAAEEAAFLPLYLGLTPFMHGTAILMSSLVGADIIVALAICLRLARRGLLRHWGKPDVGLAVRVCKYGLRGQVGGLLSLVNLRLDVAILGALAGPGVLGVYAVASKYAELLRLPGLAVTYVLYPRLAVRDPVAASKRVASLLPRAFALTLLGAVPLTAAVPLLPMVYGRGFGAAVIPSYILLFGLVGEGVAGVISAYLYGVGRPGANSLALGVAVVVTVVLDLMLIPHYHAVGASAASAAAYLTSSGALLACYFVVRRKLQVAAPEQSPSPAVVS